MPHILHDLNETQKQAVLHTEGPLLIIAGAGSGKTRTLTHRIAYLIQEKNISPWNVLAVTFTNKAAEEMLKRVIGLLRGQRPTTIGRSEILAMYRGDLPLMGTFHAVCSRILRKHVHLLGFENQFTIYDTADQLALVKQILKEQRFTPRAILGAISRAKNELVTPEQYWKYADNPFMERAAEVYEEYQKLLTKQQALDFDDLLMKTVQLLQREGEVLKQYHDQFQYISVDEYQDTNHAQYVLTNLLAGKRKNLCVVGDDAQAIYRWRGADFRNILNFSKDYPNAKVIKLERNYRSTQTILDAANAVIDKNARQVKKKLWTEKKGGKKIALITADDARDEGEWILQEIKAQTEGKKPDYTRFVVLYRMNAQSRVLEEVCLRHGIPYKIVGGVKFYERKEIKDVLAYLRVIQNPHDSVSLLRILNVPPRKIGEKTISALTEIAVEEGKSLFQVMLSGRFADLPEAKSNVLRNFADLITELQEANREFPAAGVLKTLIHQSKYKEFLMADKSAEGEERYENVKELVSVASRYDELEPGISLSTFLEEVSLVSDIDTFEEKDNAVTLMTLHAAKGLEFPTVFIVGMEEGIFPHSRALLTQEELEEERRLMYVGVTRAKDRLFLLRAKHRMFYGETKHNPPSQFLHDIPAELVEKFGEFEDADAGQPYAGLQKIPVESGSMPKHKQRTFAFHDGDKVLHRQFGEGIVVRVQGGIATVAFKSRDVGVKKLALSVAPLVKM